MADVSGNTLLMAIQAVNDAIRALEAATADAANASTDDLEMLYCYDRTARELQAAYEIERLRVSNLPPYEALSGKAPEPPGTP